MGGISVEVVFILALVLANGVFAMAELAIVSARKARLRRRAEDGDRGARTALELASDPGRFLSTVQVGITLVGTLAGVFGGATLAEALAVRLREVPALAAYSRPIALSAVVAGIAYLSLVLGELVPKRLALAHPDAIAARVATPLRWLSTIGAPLVRLLSGSTELVLRVLRVRPSAEAPITADELAALLREGRRAGVFEQAEHDMVRQVLRLDDLRAGDLVTRRPDVVWLDANDPPEQNCRAIARSPHSHFPVCDGSLDRVLGVVRIKDLLPRGLADGLSEIRGRLRVPLFFFEGTSGLKVLELFKQSGTHFAIVLDEYGAVEGVLTLTDVLEAIVGDMPPAGELPEPSAIRRDDGSWLLDGSMAVEEFADVFEGVRLPEGPYRTLAGFMIARLGRIPTAGAWLEWGAFRFEVVDMDRNRVDKVLVTPPAAEGEGRAPGDD